MNGSVGCVVGFVSSDSELVEGKPVFVDETLSAFRGGVDIVHPVVRFRLAGGITREVVVRPHFFSVTFPSGEVQASRLQVRVFQVFCPFV